MSIALDTDVLIAWLLPSHDHHSPATALVEAELRQHDARILLAPQVCWEFLHIITDPKRVASPLTMAEALNKVREIQDAEEVEVLAPGVGLVPRVLALMATYQLGRKWILDTALAATLEQHGARRLATFNGRDFACFPFIEVIKPDVAGQSPEPGT